MHRRKITGTSSNWVTTLGVLLRLSAVIHRHRSIADMPVMSLTINSGDRLSLVLLSIDPGYLQEHPLTRLDLDNEVQMLRAINITLKISHLQD
jgi:exopolyphosphatase/guanosine-5'-triphosphate,3'-diphosphate pyrophosphatase